MAQVREERMIVRINRGRVLKREGINCFGTNAKTMRVSHNDEAVI